MTLQQLRYVIAVAESGSISQASKKLLIAQPSLSKSINELEREMGIVIFYRNNRGIFLSDDGATFLSYARGVVEQADLLEEKYSEKEVVNRVFSISAQHYSFVVSAFVALVKEYANKKYEFTLRESKTADIIEDVRIGRSELGVLYLSNFNKEVILKIIKNAELEFTPLFVARPHVFVSDSHPLRRRKKVTMADLKKYTRLTYEQGNNNSFYLSEELHSTEDFNKNIVVTDRASLFNLLRGLDGFTISSGMMNSDLNGSDIISIPLESDETMEIGYISPTDRPLSIVSRKYIEYLLEDIKGL